MIVIGSFPFYGITLSIGKICISVNVNFYILSIGIFCSHSPYISKETSISIYLGPLEVSIVYNPKEEEKI